MTGRPRGDGLDRDRGAGGDFFQELGDLGEAEGLAEAGRGAALERFVDDVVLGEAGDHHEGGFRVDLAELLERLEPSHAGHADVEEGEIEALLACELEPGGAILTRVDAVPEAREDVL